MRKILFSLFFLCAFLLPIYADYTVDNVSVSAEVSSYGRAQVTTILQLTFNTAATEVTIPLPESAVSNVSAGDYKAKVQSTDDGTNLILSKKESFIGTQTLMFSYSVPYTDSGGEDSDVFTLGFLSSRWAQPIPAVSFQVVMPYGFDAEPDIVSGYYGALPAAEAGLSATETTITGGVTDLMAYDSLALSLTLDDGYFDVQAALIPGISISYLAVVMLALVLLIMIYWRLKIRSGRVQATPRLLRPEGILPCQLPMVLDGSTCDVTAMLLEWANLGYLQIGLNKSGRVVLIRRMRMGSERSRAEQRLFSKIFSARSRVAITPGRFSGSAARFQAAARRSFYKVNFDRKGGNLALVQTPCRLLLAVAVGYASALLLPDGAGFIVLAVFIGLVGLIYSIIFHSTIIRWHSLHRWNALTIICPILAVGLLVLSLLAGALPEMLLGLFACIFSGFATTVGPRRSARGLDALSQTKGCRTFYRRASWQRLQRFQGQDSRFFQSQLPGAVALHVDKRFAKRFERLPVPMPEWLKLQETATHSAADLQRQLAPVLRQLRKGFR